MAENIIKTFTIRVDTSNGKFEVDGLTKGFVKQEVALKSLNKELKKNTDGLNKLVDKSGLAGAAVVEVGRTISDSNYGITAMANNISQLSTLMITLIATTGGLSKGLSALKKAFMGPLGFIVLFQVVVAVMERFAMKSKEAEESLETLDSKVRSQTRSIELLIERIEKLNNSQEERKLLLISLSSVNEDLNIILNNRNVTEEQAIINAKKYLKELKKRNEVEAIKKALQEDIAKNDDLIIKKEEELTQAIKIRNIFQSRSTYNYNRQNEEIKIIEKEIADIRERRVEIENDYINALKELNDLETKRIANAPKSVGFYEDQISRIKKLRDATALNREDYSFQTKAIELLQEKIKEITGEEEKATKKRKGFVAKKLLFDDDILKSEQNVTKQTIHGKEQQLRAESQYQIDLASIKFEEYANREQDRVNAIEDPKLRAKAQIKADKAIAQSRDSLSRFIIQKYEETSTRINLLQINDLQKASLRLSDFMNKEAEALLSFNAQMSTNELDKIASERLLYDEQHKNKLDKIKEEIEARKLAKESYIDLEEKQANEVNKYKRQQTKFAEKEEKTKLAIANQVGQAIIGIAGEGSAVGKAVAVAMAIMNTKEAITAALGAKPYGPWNIAQAVATGVFGMQQVREIMSTKLPVEAAGGGAGAGASMSVSAPDFNVIGQGAGSQLAGVVGSRFGEPIKAYVLSSDVSSAQELDRRIDSTATIG